MALQELQFRMEIQTMYLSHEVILLADPNDNRAWQSYALGPGRSGGINDFNEANMKLAFSTELRFNIFGALNGALFVDAGNIWNVFDDIEDEKDVFAGLKSIEDSAIGSGFGLRYDLNFFVIQT